MKGESECGGLSQGEIGLSQGEIGLSRGENVYRKREHGLSQA
jgi:hypothetical protein